MDTLNGDIIYIIFSYLNSVHIFRLGLVCKFLCEPNPEFWKVLYNKNFGCPTDSLTNYKFLFLKQKKETEKMSDVDKLLWAIEKNSMEMFTYALTALQNHPDIMYYDRVARTNGFCKKIINNNRISMFGLLLKSSSLTSDALFEAASMGNLTICKMILDSEQIYLIDFVTKWDYDNSHRMFDLKIGPTALYTATINKHYDVVEYLCDFGADLNKGPDGFAPVTMAYKMGLKNIFELLVTKGADIDYVDSDGYTILQKECLAGDLQNAQYLISLGADVHNLGRGSNLLHLVTDAGHLDLVKYLIENYYFDLEFRNRSGLTPLLLAIGSGHSDIVIGLVKKDTLTDSKNMRVCVLLPNALNKHNGQLIRFARPDTNIYILLPNALNKHNGQLTRFARSDTDIYVLLPNALNKHNEHNKQFIGFIKKDPADINATDPAGRTPLYIAASKGHDLIVRFLCKEGANITTATNYGSDPIEIACGNNHIKCFTILCEYHLHINKPTSSGSTPLLLACEKNWFGNLDQLLKLGADTYAKNISGENVLHIASGYGYAPIAKFLLKNYQFNLELCTNNGFTPLFLAAMNGHHLIVKLLLQKGSGTKFVVGCPGSESDGFTPLGIACENNHAECVRVLLDNHADIKKGRHDHPCKDFACTYEKSKIWHLLNDVEDNKCIF